MKRPRLTIKHMMILVAVFAGASLVGRLLWDARPRYYNPVSASDMRAAMPETPDLAPGQTVPVSIHYNCLLNLSGRDKPTPGESVTVVGAVWLEDVQAKRYVDGYTFDALLTAGGRESASGDIVWDALPPHPGPYMLHSDLYFHTPSGLRSGLGGVAQLRYLGVPRP